jgi:hypothetical protein
LNEIAEEQPTVFTSLIQDARRAAKDAVKLTFIDLLIGLLAAVALFFITLAVYIWADEEFGAVAAGLGLGIFFLALAAAIFVTVWFRRRSDSRRETAEDLSFQALQRTLLDGNDDVALATTIEILRLIGARRVMPALALTAVIVAALQSVARAKSRAEPQK